MLSAIVRHARKPLFGAGLLWQWRQVVIGVLAAGWLVSSQAQSVPRVAAEGQPIVVREGSDVSFENISATLGTVAPKANATDPKKFDLVYTAPKDGAGKTATLRFSPVGRPAETVDIQIGPAGGVWGDNYAPAFKALFALFVVAVLLEWALALLFNWRVFLTYFDSRGAKTVVSFGVALTLVNAFGLDIMGHMVRVLWNPTVASDWLTNTLSAMVLAGGSSAVNSLMVTLGFRSVRTAETVQVRPPPTKAWLAVRFVRDQAVDGPVEFQLQSGQGGYVSLYVFHRKDRRPPFLRWLLRDPLRFPGSGGYSLAPGEQYKVRLVGHGIDGREVAQEMGPFTLAPGAIYDIEATL